MVKEIKTVEEFGEIMSDKNIRLVVVDFFTDWCGPCKRIAPIFTDMAARYPTVGFYKINAEEETMSKIVEACQIQSLPTFCFFYDGLYINRMIGANDKNLEKMLLDFFPKDTEIQEEVTLD